MPLPGDLLQILFCPRRRLLGATDLKRKCAFSAKARKVCAIICVCAFLSMVAILLSFTAFPFAWVPIMIGAAFLIFLVSTLLAYRFGRLCNAEIGPSRKNAVAHLRAASPVADAYYREVKAQGRPFTRLDLDELRHMR